MCTISHNLETASSKRLYRRHSAEFKQAIVEQSYAPGASVERIAQRHQINANQIFAWHKWAGDQRAPAQDGCEHATVFLPISVRFHRGPRGVALLRQPFMEERLEMPCKGGLAVRAKSLASKARAAARPSNSGVAVCSTQCRCIGHGPSKSPAAAASIEHWPFVNATVQGV